MFHVEQIADILVVGAGHAGIEASVASARLGAKVFLVTASEVAIANTPCNPSVGGVGKGQLVREIDALGGVMGFLADQSAIHYKTLNESKGPAVWSTRVQVDKKSYSENAHKLLKETKNLSLVFDKVCRVKKISSKDIECFSFKKQNLGSADFKNGFLVEGEKSSYFAKKIIFTVGTFLDGRLHIGAEQKDGGVWNSYKSPSMENIFDNVTILKQKFKTGTPARLKKDTIEYSNLETQDSEADSWTFHWGFEKEIRFKRQISCFLTRTNENTAEIIKNAKNESPLFNGQITGLGPRYCPSIEDKVFRYPDRNTHHVFLEPEGLDLETIYPNGLSTSLPKKIQENFLRTIEGLKRVEIDQYGYAVEYEVVDSTKLDLTLEYKEIGGLYFAGQVNGTSGYEEAAAQGLVAGINAGLALLNRDALIFDRNDSYLGVLIGDLISNVRDEPYRLFTARSENRLYIREDNTLLRMYKYRKLLGLSEKIDEFYKKFFFDYKVLWELTKNLAEYLRRGDLNPEVVLWDHLKDEGIFFEKQVVRAVAFTRKYEFYIERADYETEKLRILERKSIDWSRLVQNKNISFECRQRIERIKPLTFGQLSRITGIRAATLTVVAGELK